jgi:PadR family transcriptional regulator, regulatory protein AphA
MSSPPLTTTSYAVLGLLAIQSWSTYELTRQMDRSLGRVWPRAVSKLYEEPKKLVVHGLARASKEPVGRRSRTVYSITPKGRRALAAWLQHPGDGPVLEFEQLLKVFYSENGTKSDLLATLAATREWAQERSAESHAIGEQYLAGTGPFPERAPQLTLTSRFLTDLYALVGDWASWAGDIVNDWPEDPRQAHVDPAETIETVRRAARAAAATEHAGSSSAVD